MNSEMPKGYGVRCNTQGKLYTDETEYLINLAKQEKEANEKMKMKMRGRPKKCPDQPMKITFGEFILSFD
jgi:hypothetical protein